jgi:hypothetical protein
MCKQRTFYNVTSALHSYGVGFIQDSVSASVPTPAFAREVVEKVRVAAPSWMCCAVVDVLHRRGCALHGVVRVARGSCRPSEERHQGWMMWLQAYVKLLSTVPVSGQCYPPNALTTTYVCIRMAAYGSLYMSVGICVGASGPPQYMWGRPRPVYYLWTTPHNM